MANTYTYTGPGTRWAEGNPTAEDYLNVARVNADHLHEALNTIMDTAAADGAILLAGNIDMADDKWIGLGASGARFQWDDQTPDTVTLEDGDLYISNNNGLFIGHTAPIVGSGGSSAELQAHGTTNQDSRIQVGRWSANVNGARLEFIKSKSATIGSNTLVDDDYRAGEIVYLVDDGVDFQHTLCIERVAVNSAVPALGDIVGEYTMFLNSGDTVAQVLKVDGTNGYVHIGSDATPSTYLHIRHSGGQEGIEVDSTGSTSAYGSILLRADRPSDGQAIGQLRAVNAGGNDTAMIEFTRGSTDLKGDINFYTSNSGNRIRIDEDGLVGIGTSRPDRRVHIMESDASIAPDNASSTLIIEENNHTGIEIMCPSGKQAHIAFTDGAGAGEIRYDHVGNSMRFTTANNEVVRFDSSGNVTVGASATGNAYIAALSGDQSVGSPAFTWHGNTGTGMRRASNDTIAFDAGSVERVRIDSSGNVGIGTDNPAAILEVSKSSGPHLRLTDGGLAGVNADPFLEFYDSSAAMGYVGFTGSADLNMEIRNIKNGDLEFWTNNTQQVTIDNSGNVGIGTTAPGDQSSTYTTFSGLGITGATGTNGELTVLVLQNPNNDQADTLDATAMEFKVSNSLRKGVKLLASKEDTYGSAATSDSGFGIYTALDDAWTLGFYQDSSGNVGIGTTSPANKLSITGSYPQIQIGETEDEGLFFAGASTASHYNWLIGEQYNVSGALEITPSTAVGGTTFSTPTAVFTQSGNVGIGTTFPNAKLEVAGNIRLGSGASSQFLRFNGTSNNDIYTGTSDDTDNAQLRIGGGGDVSHARGACIQLTGNEHAQLGDLKLYAGNDAGGGAIELYTQGFTHQLALEYDGDLVYRPATAGKGFVVRESDDGGTALSILTYTDGAVLQMFQGGVGNFGIDSTGSGYGYFNLDDGIVFGSTGSPDSGMQIHIKTASAGTANMRIESTATDSYPFLSLKNDVQEWRLYTAGTLGDRFGIYNGTDAVWAITAENNDASNCSAAINRSGVGGSAQLQVHHHSSTSTIYVTTDGVPAATDYTGIWFASDYDGTADWAGIIWDESNDNILRITNSSSSTSTHWQMNTSGHIGYGGAPTSTDVITVYPSTAGEGIVVRESDDGNEACSMEGYAGGGILRVRNAGASDFYVDMSAAQPVGWIMGNFGIEAQSWGTSANGVLAIGEGTAPTSSPASVVQLYALNVAGTELKVRDESNNITTLSPHNFTLCGGPSEELAWSYYSERHGRAINVDMAKVVRLVEQLTKEQLIFLEDV